MLPTGKEITARTKLVIDEITQFVREEFELPAFKVTYKLTGKSDRSWCRFTITGPQIQLGVQSLLSKPVRAFVEYKSFNNYLEVGGFKTDDWRLHHDAVIVHEMSHAVQFALIAIQGRGMRARVYMPGMGYTETGHGSFFLAIYKRLRARFINDRVPREAYTAPRNNFDDEAVLSACAHPLQGVEVIINHKRFIVLGKEMSGRRTKYAYKGKCALTGQVYGLKLVDIARSDAAREIIQRTPSLAAELTAYAAREVTRRRPRMRW
jgi:hypothetical protein